MARNATKKPKIACGDEKAQHLSVEASAQLQLELIWTENDARQIQ